MDAITELRGKILFARDAHAYKANIENCLKDAGAALASGKDREAALGLVSALYVDLQSWFTRWALAAYVRAGELRQGDIDRDVASLRGLLRTHAPESLADLDREAAAIAESNMVKMCGRTEARELYTRWGHDYCTGLDHSLRRGARFTTSNPAKINSFRKEVPEVWAKLLEEARAEYPGAGGEKLVSVMSMKVVALYARQIYPIYEITGGEDGFCCIQVAVKNRDNAQKMIDEVLFWEEGFRRELATDNPNIVYKLPAMKAAVPVAEALVAKGIRICMTLNFSLSQHGIFAAIMQKNPRRCFNVLMSGFLDDTVTKELEGCGVQNPKQYARHAGEAVMRKSHANLRAKGYDRVSIMAAAIRGDYTIRSCFTEKSDAPVYFTTVTKMALDFDSQPRALSPEMDEEVPRDIMEVLEKSRSFRQAYNPELLDMDTVHEYAPLNMVLK
ncbi:MAG: transaldolase family protein, partial [Spirochaetia bacterium]|nr:transaldolase family protein [Spirochaetia bacterium]